MQSALWWTNDVRLKGVSVVSCIVCDELKLTEQQIIIWALHEFGAALKMMSYWILIILCVSCCAAVWVWACQSGVVLIKFDYSFLHWNCKYERSAAEFGPCFIWCEVPAHVLPERRRRKRRRSDWSQVCGSPSALHSTGISQVSQGSAPCLSDPLPEIRCHQTWGCTHTHKSTAFNAKSTQVWSK